MKVLVIGSGGREHALARGLAKDQGVTDLHAAPGNPGIAAIATLHQVDPLDPGAVLALAQDLEVDLVVIGPEAPLVAGVADSLRLRDIAVFGPNGEPAAIEGSKAFAKEIMAAADIPTARAHVCHDAAEAAAALDDFGPPYVVKDDGLAAGKGVVVTTDRQAALAHAATCERVVIEEFLDGPEVSLFGISDGSTVLAMQPAQDFKRLGDGDEGPNTGGMGAYTPLPWAPEGLVEEVRATVLQPAIDELARRGMPFVGLLYAGLALTSRGTRVIEFNARFGDPETEPLLELLDQPLGELLFAAATGALDEIGSLQWKSSAAVTVVIAADGYPASPRKGDLISGLDEASSLEGVVIHHAGTSFTADDPTQVETSGGRVLAVTAIGDSLSEARDRAYSGVELISFDGAQSRTDIAQRAAGDSA